jgi:intergrase/recombinase
MSEELKSIAEMSMRELEKLEADIAYAEEAQRKEMMRQMKISSLRNYGIDKLKKFGVKP